MVDPLVPKLGAMVAAGCIIMDLIKQSFLSCVSELCEKAFT
jgi:hypothetical protein